MLEGVFPVLATPFRDRRRCVAGRLRSTDRPQSRCRRRRPGLPRQRQRGRQPLGGGAASVLQSGWPRAWRASIPIVVGLSASDPGVSLWPSQSTQGAASVGGNDRAARQLARRPEDRAATAGVPRDDHRASRHPAKRAAAPWSGPDRGGGLRARPRHACAGICKEECLPAGQRMSRLLDSRRRPFAVSSAARPAASSWTSLPVGRSAQCHPRRYPNSTCGCSGATGKATPKPQGTSTTAWCRSCSSPASSKRPGVKAVLRLRGVIESERHRDQGPGLDAWDHREVAAILEGMAGLLGPNAVSPVAQAGHGDVG